MTLAEMANSANYAAMNYGELLNTKNAYIGAICFHIDPLLKTKRLEVMEKITRAYVTAMNAYDATREEIITCLETVGMNENHMFSFQHNPDDKTPPVNVDTCQASGERTLALLEASEDNLSDGVNAYWDVHAGDATQEDEDSESSSSSEVEPHPGMLEKKDSGDGQTEVDFSDDNAAGGTEEIEAKETTSAETRENTLVEEALEMMRALPVPEDVNVNAPYYVEAIFAYGDTAKPGYSNPKWRNMRRKDLEDFRDASVNYEKLFLKHEVLVSTDEYLVVNESLNSIRVRMYHFPKQYHAGAETISQNYDDLQDLSEDEIRARKFWLSLLKKAIKQAKEFSFLDGTDTNTPFYDRYKFSRDNKTLKLVGDRVRYYEDVNTLSEIMPSYETYARLYINRSLVLAKDNCVATVSEGKIYLVLFNIPPQKKRRCETKKARPVIMEESAPVISKSDVCTSPVQRERDLILEAVEMTRNQSVINGSYDNSSFSIQQNFFVTKDGGLFCDGKPFITTISDEVLEKNKALHRKYARTMKASSIISTDNYTAYIWNEGRSLTVFYYNTNTQAETVS